MSYDAWENADAARWTPALLDDTTTDLDYVTDELWANLSQFPNWWDIYLNRVAESAAEFRTAMERLRVSLGESSESLHKLAEGVRRAANAEGGE